MNHQSKISLILSKIFFSFLLFISYALSAETYLDEKFTAKYDLKKSNITFGRNVNRLEKIGDTFKFEITASTAGIFKLKKDERFESSIFKIHNNEIKPSTYMFTRHLKGTVEVIATNFDVKQNHGSFDNIKGCISYSKIKTETIKHEDSDCSAQDRLSVQIDYRKKLKSGKYNVGYFVIDKGREREYEFKFIDTEVIDTIFGKTETVVVKKIIQGNKRSTLTWYAVNHGFVPVKIEQYRKKTLKFTAYLTSYIK